MAESEFQKGRYVVYGTNGVCVIDDIKSMRFAAGMPEKMYYILSPIANSTSTIFVPVENKKLVSKMRQIMSKGEIDDLLAGVKAREKEIRWDSDRRSRNENFHDIMTRGVTQDMLLMIRCIHTKKKELMKNGKNLPTTDSNTLKAAEKLVEEEFAHTLDVERSEVIGYIRQRLGVKEDE